MGEETRGSSFFLLFFFQKTYFFSTKKLFIVKRSLRFGGYCRLAICNVKTIAFSETHSIIRHCIFADNSFFLLVFPTTRFRQQLPKAAGVSQHANRQNPGIRGLWQAQSFMVG